MKRLLVAMLALAVLLPSALVRVSPAAAASGYVARSGTSIVDESGNPIKLDGVNLGGYLMWEGWILGGGPDAESTMFANLSGLVGADRAAQFRADLRTNFITLADFQAIRSMGFNTVRVPFNYRLLETDADGGFATLDRLLSYGEQTGVRIVLDMHGTPAGQNYGFISDPVGLPVWFDLNAQNATVLLWYRIAQRYARRPVIAGYDLVNEPDAPNSDVLTGLYKRTIAAIRAVDTNHMIIVEGNSYAHDFRDFARFDDNLAFSFHQYPFDAGDQDANLAYYVQSAEDAGVPIWNGEYGQSTYTDIQAQINRFKARGEVDGQALWTWKLADRNRLYGRLLGSAPAPAKFKAADSWLALAYYLSDPADAPRPDPAAAETGMQSFISSVAYAATKPDAKLTAMFRAAATSGTAIKPIATHGPAPVLAIYRSASATANPSGADATTSGGGSSSNPTTKAGTKTTVAKKKSAKRSKRSTCLSKAKKKKSSKARRSGISACKKAEAKRKRAAKRRAAARRR